MATTTTIKAQNTTYTVLTKSTTMKADGTYSINQDNTVVYNAQIYKIDPSSGDIYIGYACISNVGDAETNYTFSIPSTHKTEVFALVDQAMSEIQSKIVTKL